jgi:hypothetical protein
LRHRITTGLALLVGIAILAATPSPVTGQDTIQVTQNDAWVDFPEAVDFHLAATAAKPIEHVSIEYGVDALLCGDVTTIASPSFEPSSVLDLTWRWDVVASQTIPPGGKIWWRWHLETGDGARLSTATQSAAFDDDWFVWRSLQDRNLIIHWYRGPQSLAQEVSDAGNEALRELEATTGLRLEEPVAVYLYEEQLDLRLSVPGAPAWIGGVAFPEHNTVLLIANEEHIDYATSTVRHELGHVVIERLTFNCLTDLPVWLSEGLAMVAEGEADGEALATLEEAIAADRLLTIRQIESAFSAHTDRASLSYAESYSLVRFLIDEFGQEHMLALLTAFREGATPDDALMGTYGFDTPGLQEAWRTAIGASPHLVTHGAQEDTTPAPIPTLALAALPSPQPSATPERAAEPAARSTAPATTAAETDECPTGEWLLWIVGASGALTFLVLAATRVTRRSRGRRDIQAE